jgi:RNA-directed DNA polymerase
MKESYGEGVAIHTGPESCGNGSNAVAEALTGVRAGRVLSREILLKSRVPTSWDVTEGTIGCAASARHSRTLRGRRPCARTETLLTGTGRSHGCPWSEGTRGRIEKSKDVIR